MTAEPYPASAAVSPSGEDLWTTRRLLRWMIDRFTSLDLEAPRLVAELLLAHIFQCDRIRLYMEVDRPASPAELATLRDLVRRASDHEPVQYLVQRAQFYGREFIVRPVTLIPQPCTEDLVTAAIDFIRARSPQSLSPARHLPGEPQELPREGSMKEGPPSLTSADSPEPGSSTTAGAGRDGADARILDIGTGTGCIAISLALDLPRASIIATDTEPAALELARENAAKHHVSDRIDFRAGPLFDPIKPPPAEPPLDLICSNPPYIPDSEWNGANVDESVRRHVPESATRAGRDGLDVIRPLIHRAPDYLAPAGRLLIEIAHSQAHAVLALVQQSSRLTNPRILPDAEGFNRFLLADRAPSADR